jgi:hypothetical protein
MNLPFFKKISSGPKREYLFSLEIGYETVRSAIWTVANDRTQVLTIGKTVSCTPAVAENLIAACDQTLTDCTGKLDSTGKIQPEKVILGLPVNWVSQDKIEPEKLHLLRDLTQKLSLSAVGFVVTPQALVRYLQHTEGVPPTAILIGFWQNTIEVTQVRLGKIESTHMVKRSNKAAADVIEGLSRQGSTGMLPSRMLLYDADSDLESVKQNLLAFPWQAPQTKLPFLHFPKIEILPPDFSVKAISLAGGSEVAQAIGLITQPPPETPSPQTPVVSATPEDLGFVSEVDIATLPESPPSPSPEPPAEKAPLPEKVSLPKFKLPSFHIHFPRFTGSLKLIALVIAFLLVLAGLGSAYWFLPKATVTISVDRKSLQNEFNITADSAVASLDQEKLLLPVSIINTEVSGQKSKTTTGSVLTGEKATGEVTVINGTSSPRTFPAGTSITSSSGLIFSFNSAVEVASASGTADPNSYQPGKATVKITANVIGSDSNLSAGTQFKIGTFSTMDYVAKNDVAFSGGSSRQVAAVSKSDISDLRSQLNTQLQEQAKADLITKKTSGFEIINESIKYTPAAEKFNQAVDEVASEVSLELSMRASAYEFAASDLEKLVTAEIESLIPDGYQLSGKPEYQFTIGSVKDKQTQLTVRVAALLLPRLNQDQIIQNISGKFPAAVKDYLTGLPGVSRVNFQFSLPLPRQILTLPHIASNIKIVIEPGDQ